MGIICILLGLVVFLGSILLGCFTASWAVNSEVIEVFLTQFTNPLTNNQIYMICIGVLGFIGLLIGLNMVMHGLVYVRLRKVLKLLKHRK